MKIAVIIPSRLSAVRLPNKPLLNIKGLPMVISVMKQAMEANIGAVYVACCGEEIANVVRTHGGTAIITDPNLPSGTDRTWAAAQNMDADIIVNVQGDLPLVKPSTIKAAADILRNYPDDIGTVSYRDIATHNPSHVTIAMHERGPLDGKALYFSRSSIPHGSDYVDHHIGIYSYRRAALEKFCSLPPHPLEVSEKLEQLRALAHGMSIGVRRVEDQPRSVDTLADWESFQ